MNRKRRREIFEAVGLIAIVGSLVFLALETRQNTNALYAESRQSVLAGAQHDLLIQLDNPDIGLSVIKSEPLTPKEHVRLSVFLTTSLKAKEFAWLQYQDGVIDEEQWHSQIVVIQVIFDAQRNRRWWDKLGREYFKGGFRDFIDSVIAGQPATDRLWDMESSWTVD